MLGDEVEHMTVRYSNKTEYYLYYNEETGLRGHPHDIESVSLQIKVHQKENFHI